MACECTTVTEKQHSCQSWGPNPCTTIQQAGAIL